MALKFDHFLQPHYTALVQETIISILDYSNSALIPCSH